MLSLGKKFLFQRILSILLALTLLMSTSAVMTVISIAPNYLQDINQPVNVVNESGQPTGSHWFPEEFLNWDPLKDPNAVYNISNTSLATRIDKSKIDPVNSTQNKDLEVVAISIMNKNTSGSPSQGSDVFEANTFSYWQYIDSLVYWGGSSSEGIIVPPTPDVTDSAHKNGVPVLGTVFFPQIEHGGTFEWVEQFLVKNPDGTFPIANKLIELANYYNFDGWFINQETVGGTAEHSKLMQQFILYFKNQAPDLDIMWYDSMTVDGKIEWQNALNDKNKMFLIDDNGTSVADSMFLNFWWNTQKYEKDELLKNSEAYATANKVNPYKLFAGVDVQEKGYNTDVRWNLFEKTANTPFTSLGLYCPSWTFFSSSTVSEFLEKESKFWVNENGDPRIPTTATDKAWKGISHYAIEKSIVNGEYMQTNFSMGNGQAFFHNGVKISDKPWNNRSLAGVMPTYRWIVEHSDDTLNTLKPEIDYTDAYSGGNSISMTGKMTNGESSSIMLFSSDIDISTNAITFSALLKASETGITPSIKVTYSDGTTGTVASSNTISNTSYTHHKFEIPAKSGTQIKNISLLFESNANINNAKINIGLFAIGKDFEGYIPTITSVDYTELFSTDGINGGIRYKISTDVSLKDTFSNIAVYREMSNGNLELVQVGKYNDGYISNVKREGKQNKTKFIIKSFNNGGSATSESVQFEVTWPKYPLPIADFSASTTFINPGESVTFTNKSSQTAETFEWILPGAAVESSNEASPTVTYDKVGNYPVTLVAKNESGVSKKDAIITVSSVDKNLIQNLSKNKNVKVSSQVNDSESGMYAVDGDSDPTTSGNIKTKWCAIGSGPHTITIDLGEPSVLTSIAISNAEAGGEGKEYNTKSYSVYGSNDPSIFEANILPDVEKTLVGNVSDNIEGISKSSLLANQSFQYVQVVIDGPTQTSDTAARIYDIDVRGIPSSTYPAPLADFVTSQTFINPGENVVFTNKSSLSSDSFEWHFPGARVEFSNEVNPTVTYDKVGSYPVTLIAKNSIGQDTKIKESIITVSTIDKNLIQNLSRNKNVIVSSQANDSSAGIYAVDGDEDINKPGNIATKWYAVDTAPHTITIDLGEPSILTNIAISNAEAGGEAKELNTKAYTVYASNDPTIFQNNIRVNPEKVQLGNVTDNVDAVSETALLANQGFQYIQIVIDTPTQTTDVAARIYDIDVRGIPNSKLPAIPTPDASNPTTGDYPAWPILLILFVGTILALCIKKRQRINFN